MPPVEDHPVHEKTQIKGDKPYGCNNVLSPAEGYWAPDLTFNHHGEPQLSSTWVERRMSRDCRYDLARLDSRCTGCIRARPAGGAH